MPGLPHPLLHSPGACIPSPGPPAGSLPALPHPGHSQQGGDALHTWTSQQGSQIFKNFLHHYSTDIHEHQDHSWSPSASEQHLAVVPLLGAAPPLSPPHHSRSKWMFWVSVTHGYLLVMYPFLPDLRSTPRAAPS